MIYRFKQFTKKNLYFHVIFFFFNCSILVENTNHQFNVVSGYVNVPNSNQIVVVSMVYQVVPKYLQVKAKSSLKVEYLTSIKNSKPITLEQYNKQRDLIKEKNIEVSVCILLKLSCKLSHLYNFFITAHEKSTR